MIIVLIIFDMIRRRIYLQIYQLDKEASQSKCLSAVLWIISLEWGPHLHLCPEMHAVTKMANLMKFHQIKWMFMVLTILTNLHHSGYCMHFWTYLDTSNCTNIKLRGDSLTFGCGWSWAFTSLWFPCTINKGLDLKTQLNWFVNKYLFMNFCNPKIHINP